MSLTVFVSSTNNEPHEGKVQLDLAMLRITMTPEEATRLATVLLCVAQGMSSHTVTLEDVRDLAAE